MTIPEHKCRLLAQLLAQLIDNLASASEQNEKLSQQLAEAFGKIGELEARVAKDVPCACANGSVVDVVAETVGRS